MDLKVILLAVLATVSHAKETTYELALSDENLFSTCPDASPGTLDVHGFLDLSQFSTSLEESGIKLSGNQTFIWDVQPQDRITVVIKLLYFDRGTWTPTIFSVKSNDLCKVFYDSKQVWYEYWLGHVTNIEDIRDSCVNPGTKLIFENYTMVITTTFGSMREGLYKIRIYMQAFDHEGTERPTKLCFDIMGHLQKQNNA